MAGGHGHVSQEADRQEKARTVCRFQRHMPSNLLNGVTCTHDKFGL